MGTLGFALLAEVDITQALINVLTNPSVLALILIMIPVCFGSDENGIIGFSAFQPN